MAVSGKKDNTNCAFEQLLNSIAHDPIIQFYLKMARATERVGQLPQYSETQLRLAIKQTRAHPSVPLQRYEVDLYSKLLLLYYCRQYRSKAQLLSIMKGFDERRLEECFKNINEIVNQWSEFFKSFLLCNLYKEAFTNILYEWALRYYKLNGQLQQLDLKATSILKYLACDLKYLKPWLNSFKIKLSTVNLSKETAHMKAVTKDELTIRNIVADIRHKFNSIMIDSVVPFKMQESHQKTIPSINVEDFLDVTRPISDQRAMSSATETPAKKAKIEVIKVEVLPTNATFQITQAGSDNKNNKDVENRMPEKIHSDTTTIKEEFIQTGCDISCTSECGQQEYITIERQMRTEECKPISKVIDYHTAIAYVSALQGYALSKGQLEAISLLDRVDSIFRKEQKK